MKKTFLILASLLFVSSLSFGQKNKPKVEAPHDTVGTVVISGKVLNLETGEPIGIERLIIRPTAEFCADIKYINDDQEKHFAE